MNGCRAVLSSWWLAMTLGCAASLEAADCVVPYPHSATRAEPFGLRLDGVSPEVARAALEMWEACRAAGAGFPELSLDARPARIVPVRAVPASGRMVCGELRGREILLYGFARLPSGSVVRCEPWTETLAHELGHLLGLLDAPPGEGCDSHIMAVLPLDGSRRTIHAEECRAVDARWRTWAEEWAPLGERFALGHW